jgi:hypothetical protein
VSIDLSFIYLNDIFHSLQTILKSQGLSGSSILVSEGESFHEFFILNSLTLILQDAIAQPNKRVQNKIISMKMMNMIGYESHILDTRL